MTLFKPAFPLILLCLLGGCAAVHAPEPAPTDASLLYSAAMTAYEEGDLGTAIDKLELLESYTPPEDKADAVRLTLVLANHRLGRYSQTIAAANRFIGHHPRHAQLDQVLYLRGDSYFRLNQAAQAEAQGPTDPAPAQQAYRDFNFLAARFPNSRYRDEAQRQALLLREQLAAYELRVAGYYLKQGSYVAAANRSRYLLENYQDTEAVPAALAIMADAYAALGLEQPAAGTRAVLTSNFPGPGASAAAPPQAAAGSNGLQAPEPQALREPEPQAIQAAAEAKQTTAALPPGDGWVLQLASFKDPVNAQRLEARLRAGGYHAFLHTGPDYTRVLVGAETERRTIERLRRQLHTDFKLLGIVKAAAAVR